MEICVIYILRKSRKDSVINKWNVSTEPKDSIELGGRGGIPFGTCISTLMKESEGYLCYSS